MYQQYFNAQVVWVLSQGEFIGFIAALAVIALGFFLFLALTAPVSIPYLKTRLSKDKYMLLVLDKTHRIKMMSGKLISNVVEATGINYAAYVKNDDSGSYNLGAVKMDVISSGSALVHHDQYISAIETMKKLGIESEEDAAAVVTNYLMEKRGLKLPAGARIPNLSVIPKEEDIDVLIPIFNRVSMSDLGRWLSITPETIKGWSEAEKDLLKKRLTKKDGNPKGGMPSGLFVIIGIGILALIIVMALMKNGTM